eukprot:12047497-Alexandrium_andersonii.AAC.1
MLGSTEGPCGASVQQSPYPCGTSERRFSGGWGLSSRTPYFPTVPRSFSARVRMMAKVMMRLMVIMLSK